MRGLSESMQQQLLEILKKQDFESALISLVLWGAERDGSAPGNEEINERRWQYLKSSQQGPAIAPDDLDEVNPAQLQEVHVLDLLGAVESVLHSDWRAASTRAVVRTAADVR